MSANLPSMAKDLPILSPDLFSFIRKDSDKITR